MRYPNVWYMPHVLNYANAKAFQVRSCSGRLVLERPIGEKAFFSRCRAALLVFRGKADAVLWDNQ